jgi:hypothetical protein
MCYAFLLWKLKPLLLKKSWNCGETKKKPSSATTKNDEQENSDMCEVSTSEKKKSKVLMDWELGAPLLRMDDKFLVIFPVTFLLFHIVYWSVCLSHTQTDPTLTSFWPVSESTEKQFMYE